ncbi:acyl-CoA reductase [Vaginella massiliensis]|uniref:acyl-CoA reductase n=1 Tax=Vaginella massiliensis TaxID=1816680 RepID=UPI0008396F3E|nr:acyl-CoA reductase [Vaginella massiliensis]
MTFEERISAFDELGQFFLFLADGRLPNDNQFAAKFNYWKAEAEQLMISAENSNPWFTQENISFALKNWGEALAESNLRNWTLNLRAVEHPKNIGIIMAGNLPLVGFHDLLCVVDAGHRALIKPSSKDEKLLQLVCLYLNSIHEDFDDLIQKVEKLSDFDAVIATGSNNTARYFEQYFEHVPHIIRKNRTSVAILEGNESEKELQSLGEDLFRYFGLGCRNVTKLYVRDENQLQELIKAIFPWGVKLLHQTKYANNYDYNRAIYLLSKDEFYDNNFVLFKKDASLHSPLAVIHYELYDEVDAVLESLDSQHDDIQCIVSHLPLKNGIAFGQTQKPNLDDYADNIDTLQFLVEL